MESYFLRFGHGGTNPVRGPRRLLPYAAGSGPPVLAFFLLLLPGFLFLLRSKPSIVPRARLLAHCSVFVFPPVSSSLWAPSPCTWKYLFHFISIGHIIASETEEEIFRALGTSHHYICIFLVICEREACVHASCLYWGRWRLTLRIGQRLLVLFHQGLVKLTLTCHRYPLCRCSVGGTT